MERYHRALVLGVGASGESAAHLLLSEGVRVVVIDGEDGAMQRERAARCEEAGAEVRLGSRELPPAGGTEFDVCIASPGVPGTSPWFGAAKTRGIPILSELELGVTRCRARVLAVTGTNGKSTLVKLCGDALALAGLRVQTGGNYGPPACEIAMASGAPDWAVLEVSSFHLETTRQLKPDVAVLLNVQPDHLDRHGDMDTYFRVKERLFENMDDRDTALIPDTLRARIGGRQSGPAWQTFGDTPGAVYRFADHSVLYEEGGTERAVSFAGTVLDNEVTGLACAAAVGAVKACGVDPSCVGSAAEVFETLPHRMQVVAVVDGVRFVDDSKATNLAAMTAALRVSGNGVRLIAGGRLKEGDLAAAKEVLASVARSVYLIGEAAGRMNDAWVDMVPCRVCGDLANAVADAWADAGPGDTVLLSPACASFDQFQNYKERGETFIRCIRKIEEEKS